MRPVAVLLLASLLVGCTDRGAAPSEPADSPSGSPATSPAPSPPATPTEEPTEKPTAEPLASDGKPRRALLTIPKLGLREVPVVPYRGFTDDAPGTEIQNRGVAASPYGPRGGTGPGGLGNYQVTGHRLSSTQVFLDLPDLRKGDRVYVEARGVRYTYRITTTRITSFRSPRELREQRAAVPGHPGVEPRRAMITLSTCRTPEDRAEGNYWSDELGNPEHRIDKIGVLTNISP